MAIYTKTQEYVTYIADMYWIINKTHSLAQSSWIFYICTLFNEAIKNTKMKLTKTLFYFDLKSLNLTLASNDCLCHSPKYLINN